MRLPAPEITEHPNGLHSLHDPAITSVGEYMSVTENGTTTGVQGTVAPGFEPVREAFEASLAEERSGHSAQLAAYVHGEQVVDLWGGPGIAGDSLTGVFSSSKGAVYLVVALLVQDGVLELDREVRHYWPEFAQAGKEHITLRDLLSHRAGLIGVEGGFSPEELADDRAIAARLAGQRPWWRPGAAFGYHALVIGALAGEVVLRATGSTVQELYESRIRAPYGLDFYLGLPEEQEHRWLSTQPMDPTPQQKRELARPARAARSACAASPSTSTTSSPPCWRSSPTPAPYGPTARPRPAASARRAAWPACTRRPSAAPAACRRC
ncbi:hypothetical protein GCM10010218_62350 [Streptomyces mashuensis]|uniref:Beta-lactamase-related domain-containing protein n=1 Tax=Streptomyces mashuensis TaxID=33904 RepID=A0A919B8P9_9ACTN|nr:hypothetical protein GCM10010218_62350 [Streptomyces mashuensis]